MCNPAVIANAVSFVLDMTRQVGPSARNDNLATIDLSAPQIPGGCGVVHSEELYPGT